MGSSSLTVPKRKFGWTDAKVPIIGQGTWKIEGNGRVEDRQKAIEALKLGLDLGLTHIDTAEMYGNGRVEEEIVAKAISERREEVFLVSKVWPSNASYEGTLKACQQSLNRLKTDWLDLYLLHWPSDRYNIKETMHAMEKLVYDGLIRFIGVSNFDTKGLEEAEQALTKYQIACDQVPYNLGNRQIEHGLLPYCTDRNIAIVGYSPLGHGNFPSLTSIQGKVLDDIAKRHDRTPRQVVLNYLTRDPSVFTIPKATNFQHVRENSNSVGDWNLTNKDIADINRAFHI